MNTDNTPAPALRRRAGLIAGGAVALVAATVGVTLAVTAGPSSTPAAQQQTQAAARTAAAAIQSDAPTAAATTSAAPAPAGPAVLKFGAKAEGPKSTSVVYAYKQPVATKAPRPEAEGFEWGAADIEVCVRDAGTISRINWHLTYADHTVIDASSTGYDGFPAPAYPWDDRDVAAGGCVRGWLTFAVPPGKRPVTVQYLPRDFAADWQVS